MTVRFARDISVEEARAAYRVVVATLEERKLRFAANLAVVRPERVLDAMNTLWSGGDLGG